MANIQISGVKISQMQVRDNLTGEELIPFSSQGVNGAFKSSKLIPPSVDSELSDTSENAVQNKTVTNALSEISENMSTLTNKMKVITKAEYDAIAEKDAGTVYFLKG